MKSVLFCVVNHLNHIHFHPNFDPCIAIDCTTVLALEFTLQGMRMRQSVVSGTHPTAISPAFTRPPDGGPQ